MYRVLSRLVLFATVLVAACGKEEQPRSDQRASPPPKTTSASPLATQGEFPGITVSVQEVRRADKSATLKFVISNQSQKDFAFGYNFGEGPSVVDFGSIAGTHLIDSTNKTYPVLRDNDHKCLCSQNIANISAGSQTVLWARFDAPPPSVQKVSVVVPHFPPIDDVPVIQTPPAGDVK